MNAATKDPEVNILIWYQEQRVFWQKILAEKEFELRREKDADKRETLYVVIALVQDNVDFCTEQVKDLL